MATWRLSAPVGTANAQSSSSGISGIPCKLSRRTRGGRNADGGSAGGLRWRSGRIMAQQQAEEGGGGGDAGGDDDFEARLAKLQRKVTSGTGKKAELRKARKEGGSVAGDAGASAPKDGGIFIAPVALKEPVSDGLPVVLGINSYTERLHGRLAALGLAAVLLVELATGDSFVKFHDSGTLTVQVYAIFGLAALFVKFEKERVSVWPKS